MIYAQGTSVSIELLPLASFNDSSPIIVSGDSDVIDAIYPSSLVRNGAENDSSFEVNILGSYS